MHFLGGFYATLNQETRKHGILKPAKKNKPLPVIKTKKTIGIHVHVIADAILRQCPHSNEEFHVLIAVLIILMFNDETS